MKRTPIFCLLTLAAGMSACSDAGEGPPPPSAPAKKTSFSDVAVNPKASWTTAKQRDSVVIQPNKLVFPASGNDALLKKKAGDILVSDRSTKGNNPDGFMLKVVSVAKQGDKIEVTTEPAYLNEVLVGHFDVVADPTDLRLMTPQELGTSAASLDVYGPGFQPQGEVSAGFDLGGEVKDRKLFEVKVGAMDVPVNGGKVSVSLNGAAKIKEASFHFKPSIRVGGEIDVPGGFWDKFNPVNYVQEFHVISKGQVDTALIFNGSVQLAVKSAPDSLKKELKDLASKVNDQFKQLNPPTSLTLPIVDLPFVGPPLPTPIGPIPLTYQFKIELACSATLSGGFEADLGFTGSAVAEFGTIYQKDKGWSPVNTFDLGVNKVGPNWKANGSAELKCALEPKLSVKVAGFAGPFIKVSGSVAIKGQYKEECPPNGAEGKPTGTFGPALDANFNVGLGAEAKFSILSKEIKLAEASFSLYDKTWNLWKPEPFKLPEGWSIGYCAGDTPLGQGGAGAGGGGSSGSGGSGSGSSAGSGSGSSAGSGQGGSGAAAGSGQGGSGSGSSASGEQGGSGSGSSAGSGGDSGSAGSGSGTGASCGNGKLDGGNEDCDGSDFGGKTCASLTLNPGATGNPTCTASCKIDSSSCSIPTACGDVCTPTDTAQKPECGSCQQTVCAANSYCCEVAWDIVCVSAAESACGVTCN